ncbi:BrnT family toxin [Silvibacterium dinghuense]|uniref:BrnT family toxin n=1 Tax=Silvibacterium dinghuense TaxID=1560006 RepID=A0A4Q1SJ02_9BACT|nr:BrnT family toxin [Silvibacterium dinghuense]GGG97286.1 hypothetical protein GCM10011586_10700 [Silvibacterium dinghuense]
MQIEFDLRKHERNLRERGLGFEQAAEFDFESATTVEVFRHGEQRFVSIGYLGERLHVLCFRETADGIRIISFRKANDREARKYGKPKILGA